MKKIRIIQNLLLNVETRCWQGFAEISELNSHKHNPLSDDLFNNMPGNFFFQIYLLLAMNQSISRDFVFCQLFPEGYYTGTEKSKTFTKTASYKY